MREVSIPPGEADRRVDKFLFQYLNNAPHSFIYRLLRTKKIKLNGKRAQGSELILPGDRLAVFLSEDQFETCMAERIIPQAKQMPEIIFEDESILIINKPAGLASHGGMENPDHLLARILYYLNRQTGFTPALCNRLDVNTSGLITCAKTFAAARELNRMFAEREAAREYLAVVRGELYGSQTLEGFYRKDEALNKAFITNEGTVKAATSFESVCTGSGYTLIKVFPITGRSHQIRAHMASIGHPLLGDVKYGGKKTDYAPAQLLHCKKLVLAGHEYEAQPPNGFQRCVKELFG